jgi:predicted small secreted protein
MPQRSAAYIGVLVVATAAFAGCNGRRGAGSSTTDGGDGPGTGGAAGTPGTGGLTGGTIGSGGSSGGANGDMGGTGGTGGPPPAVPIPGGAVTLGTPVTPGDWTGTPTTTGTTPVIVYPSDQTRFPRNIYRTLFQWRSQGYAQFRLTFTGPGGTVTVFTDGKHPLCVMRAGAACWEADEMAWSYIAGGNAGATVTFTVDGLDTAMMPPVVRRSASITIGFSRYLVEGAIFYWSTTAAGIRRANIAAAEPESYLTGKPQTVYESPADEVKCAACHVVSRDGKYMVAPVSAASGGSLWIMEVTRAAPPTPLVKKVPNTGGHGFATISPDNGTVVAAWGGKMWMVDRATGAHKGDITVGGAGATHPDWSPDNSQLVFATGKGDGPANAAIATIPFMDGTWGPATTIVPVGMDKKTNLFPMHSPDGKWIAYTRGKGGHGDLTSQLWLVPAKGGTPVELVNGNRVVSNAMGDGLTENSQPTWAPPGDYNWIAFNSQREYGLVSPKGTQQIWVAAIDLAKAAKGEDPSYPAFRLQFQGLEEDNHRAFWTLDVRDPPKTPPRPVPDAGACVMANATCTPGVDSCCDATYKCESRDDGMSYKCLPRVVID